MAGTLRRRRDFKGRQRICFSVRAVANHAARSRTALVQAFVSPSTVRFAPAMYEVNQRIASNKRERISRQAPGGERRSVALGGEGVCRYGRKRLYRQAGLAPGLEASTERADVFEANRGGAKRYASAGCLSGLRTVEDHFALSGNRVVGMAELRGIDHARSRNLVRRQRDVERGSEIDDHERIARLQPLVELQRRDARCGEVPEEAMPPDVLPRDVERQRPTEEDGKRSSDGGGPRHQNGKEIGAEIAEGDPDAAPEQGACRGIEQESLGSDGDDSGESRREWVHAGQKLGQNHVAHPMCEEAVFRVADERIGVE